MTSPFRVHTASRIKVDSPASAFPAPDIDPKLWHAPPSHPRKILVADDESLAAASVVLALRQLGYTAIGPAKDGEHAIELAFSTMPDLAIMDARMSTDDDGIHASHALFNELFVPVVMLSAHSDRQQVTSAASAGVFSYLVKPAGKDQLHAAIEVAWSRFNEFISKEIEATALYHHLEDRRDMDRAAWLLVERDGMEESEARRELRRRSAAQGKPVGDIARDVIQSGKRS